MAGGTPCRPIQVSEDSTDFAVDNRRRPVLSCPYQDDTLRNVTVRDKVVANMVTPREDDTPDPVVNLKKKISKVLPPLQSPEHYSSDTPGLLVKRKASCMEETSNGCTDGKDIQEIMKLVDKVNLNVKKKDPHWPEDHLIFDHNRKNFSGSFSPNDRRTCGNGSNGQVDIFTDQETKKSLTMKTIQIAGEFGKTLRQNEVIVPHLSNSINIVKVFGLAHNGDKAFIVMEYAGRSLLLFVKMYPELLCRPEAMESIALDMASGLDHLHHLGIVHCDAKPENVCVDKASGRPGGLLAKWIDCASSQRPRDPATVADITPEYLDPQFNAAFCKRCPPRLTTADDVWALGQVVKFIDYKGHPMIVHHLHKADYPPEDLPDVRTELVRKIGQMTSLPEDFLQFRGHPVLEQVLAASIIMEKSQRATAKQLVGILKQETKAKKIRLEASKSFSTTDAQRVFKLTKTDYMPMPDQEMDCVNDVDKKKQKRPLPVSLKEFEADVPMEAFSGLVLKPTIPSGVAKLHTPPPPPDRRDSGEIVDLHTKREVQQDRSVDSAKDLMLDFIVMDKRSQAHTPAPMAKGGPADMPILTVRGPQVPGYTVRGPEVRGFTVRAQEVRGYTVRAQEVPAGAVRAQGVPAAKAPQVRGYIVRGSEVPAARGPQVLGYTVRGPEVPAHTVRRPEVPAHTVRRPEVPAHTGPPGGVQPPRKRISVLQAPPQTAAQVPQAAPAAQANIPDFDALFVGGIFKKA